MESQLRSAKPDGTTGQQTQIQTVSNKAKPGFILIFPISQESESYKNCFLLKIFFNSSELSPKIEISVISYVKKIM